MSLKDFAKELEKVIGSNDKKQTVTQFVDTGYPPLNKIISGKYDGGIPLGRLVEIYGPSSSGKTALATMIMVKAQQMGGIAGFCDHERSFNIDLAKNFGLDDTFPRLIYKQPKTWEESNMIMAKAAITLRKNKAVPDDAPIVFVLDSIAAAVPQSVFSKDLDELTMNDTTALARVTSSTLKTMAAHAAEWNFTIIYLNQIRQKPGIVYGESTYTSGGGAMEFFASVRLSLSRKKIVDSSKEFVGQTINIKSTKNKLTRPFQTTDVVMGFDENGGGYFDFETSVIEALIDAKKLNQSGAWIEFNGRKYQKKQLAKAIREEGLMPKLVSLLGD